MSLQLGFPPEFFERGRPAVRIDQGQTHFRRLRLTSKLDRDRLVVRLELQAELLGRIEEHVRLPVVSIPRLLVDPEEGWPRPMQERTSMGDRVPSRSANGNLDGSGGLVVDG